MVGSENWRDFVGVHLIDGEDWVVVNEISPVLDYSPNHRGTASMNRQLKGRRTKLARIGGKGRKVLLMLPTDVDELVTDSVIHKPRGFSTTPCKFYILQLYSQHYPKIVVMGKTEGLVADRIRDYQSDHKNLLREYNLPAAYHEQTLIDMMCKGLEKLSREQAIVPNLEEFLERADKIVDLLPISSYCYNDSK